MSPVFGRYDDRCRTIHDLELLELQGTPKAEFPPAIRARGMTGWIGGSSIRAFGMRRVFTYKISLRHNLKHFRIVGLARATLFGQQMASRLPQRIALDRFRRIAMVPALVSLSSCHRLVCAN